MNLMSMETLSDVVIPRKLMEEKKGFGGLESRAIDGLAPVAEGMSALSR